MLNYINCARTRWGGGRFSTGDCHTLAMALHEAAGRTGKLLACLYGNDCYSHMVLLSADQRSWDIDGDNAQQRWTAKLLAVAARWAEVPCEDADYKDTKRWLRAHNARLNTPLQRQLLRLFNAQ